MCSDHLYIQVKVRLFGKAVDYYQRRECAQIPPLLFIVKTATTLLNIFYCVALLSRRQNIEIFPVTIYQLS